MVVRERITHPLSRQAWLEYADHVAQQWQDDHRVVKSDDVGVLELNFQCILDDDKALRSGKASHPFWGLWVRRLQGGWNC